MNTKNSSNFSSTPAGRLEKIGRKSATSFCLMFATFLFFLTFLESVEAIPVFARRYSITCAMCHVGIPKLNGFGEAFAGNGYQMPGENMRDHTKDVGDEKLFLLEQLPLAIRVDSFFRARNDTNVDADLEAPFTIKILSSAPLTNHISYYFYFLFNERGSVAGVEDAFIYFNNAYKDLDLDLRVGQFQVMDVLFPREQRLTFQDYTYYVTAVSDSGFKLTYDRIIEMNYNFEVSDNIGMGFVAAVANGNGIDVAGSDRNFDSDNFKNYYGRVSLAINGQTLGLYGYHGEEKNDAGMVNEFFRIGPDFEVAFDDFNIWGSFLYGEDDNPRFMAVPETVESWGGFVGLTYPFKDDWIFSALYNYVNVEGMSELNANTVTANLTYYLMRNFKVMAEFTGDLEGGRAAHPREHTGVIGFVLAY